ncbi:hypothetical protein E4U37_002534 [Claviceps purpurea]|nr:hypothetical protein E4U37_002534 [Claviceps purpurea]
MLEILTSMSLKLEIETWVAALDRYNNNDFREALMEFEKICDTSKILFNMGVIHATLGEHEKAVECYERAISLDRYLAIAHFQRGVSNFILGNYNEALINFNAALEHLRGNTVIDYAQLGLLFRLYSCEVLYNRGLCYINLQQRDIGMNDLFYAAKEKIVQEHDVIDEAICEEAKGYTVFSIPVGVIYRPNEAKVRNLKAKDYLGKAKLIAASDGSNAFTGFAGFEMMNARKSEAKDSRPVSSTSFAASNLVKRDLLEIPVNCNMPPPTPPPETVRHSRGSSLRNGSRATTATLSIQTQGSNRQYEKSPSPQDVHAGISATSSVSSQGFHRRDFSYGHRRPSRPIEEVGEADGAVLYNIYPGSGVSNGRISRDGRRPSLHSVTSPQYLEKNSSSEVRHVRVKVHAADIRYIMVDTAIEYPDFVAKITDKFGLKRRFKMKIEDEDMPGGDMITVGDQDDLEMAVQSATSLAQRQGASVAKMEVCGKISLKLNGTIVSRASTTIVAIAHYYLPGAIEI